MTSATQEPHTTKQSTEYGDVPPAVRSESPSYFLRLRSGWELIRVDRETAVHLSFHLKSQNQKEVPVEPSPQQTLPTVLSLLQWNVLDPINILLGSEHVLAATFSAEGVTTLGKRELLPFELETQLPWSAEEFTSDFIEQGEAVMGVAVQNESLRELLKEIDELGGTVDWIIPEAFFLLESVPPKGMGTGDCSSILDLRLATRSELFLILGGTIHRWRSASSPSLRDQTISLWMNEFPGAERIDGDSLASHETSSQCVFESEVNRSDTLFLLEVARLVRKGWKVPINLRRGTLGDQNPYRRVKREVMVLLVSLSILLLTATSLMWWRATLEEQRAFAHQSEQEELFEELFPKQNVPAGVHSRLLSELKRIEATRGKDARESQPKDSGLVLDRFLGAIPDQVRLRLNEVNVVEDHVVTTVEVRSQADASAVTRQLERAGFQSSESRSVQRIAQGVSLPIDVRLGPVAEETPR